MILTCVWLGMLSCSSLRKSVVKNADFLAKVNNAIEQGTCSLDLKLEADGYFYNPHYAADTIELYALIEHYNLKYTQK